ncbi:MAG: glutathione S-transferase [Betaproteobacteria bacterium]|nr:glutathione S-transferase [Betaproteobacteria bacterium]
MGVYAFPIATQSGSARGAARPTSVIGEPRAGRQSVDRRHLTHPVETPILRFAESASPFRAAVIRATDVSLPTLVTITLSHYCEKARWGLDRAGIAYREARHAPGFHAFAVRRAGGRRTTPILVTDDGVIGDSTDILLWANGRAPPGRALYPEDRAERAEVLALEERFDEDLGPHVRRAIYFDLLPSPKLTIPMMTHGVPGHQRALLPLLYGPLQRVMRSSMRIDAAGAKRSLDTLMAVVDDVSKLLADGRRYLAGDRFGAADITFAALAAPAVCPPGYAVPLPRAEDLPAGAAAIIRGVRDTPAGAFCLRMYRDERR